MSSEQVENFDVIVVGAGLAGSSLAVALGAGDLQVALVEAMPMSADWPEQLDSIDGFDPRVSALTAASQGFLQRLGVWESLCEQRIAAYDHMHVWDAEGTGFVDFDAAEVGGNQLGHIVENRITVAALNRQIQQYRNVHVFNPAKVAAAQCAAEGSTLTLEDGRQLRAPLIVAADGANSRLRQQMGFETREWDYDHSAIVATVETELAHDNTAWQRFLPEGPLAFLPLARQDGGKQYCSIVWSALPQYAENLMALDDTEFCRQLGRAFENKLGNIVAVSRRFSFPLRQRHAVDYVKPGIALVADAAHTIHPLAGQGINIGLQDVRVLAEELVAAHSRGLALTDFAILQRYQRRRKGDNLAMMAGMEGFKRLFAQTALPLRWLRNTGMHAFNRSAAIKARVIRQAMGL